MSAGAPLSQIFPPLARSGVHAAFRQRQGPAPGGLRARHGAAVGDPDGMTDMSATPATDGVATYRPLGSLMFFSRLLRERFAGAPYADRFLAGAA